MSFFKIYLTDNCEWSVNSLIVHKLGRCHDFFWSSLCLLQVWLMGNTFVNAIKSSHSTSIRNGSWILTVSQRSKRRSLTLIEIVKCCLPGLGRDVSPSVSGDYAITRWRIAHAYQSDQVHVSFMSSSQSEIGLLAHAWTSTNRTNSHRSTNKSGIIH